MWDTGNIIGATIFLLKHLCLDGTRATAMKSVHETGQTLSTKYVFPQLCLELVVVVFSSKRFTEDTGGEGS